ncbi:MAG: alkaline phosphatase family protein [Sandaracinus sp.]|nr:alkaline phosphatase family protein [Sandaracinus sp.]MCB9614457.1 alkaline phosphatase family protein [Sandaracinus sp.]MCB9618599.1 alkaline phosphatase family protein [Sandaracinus sp.]
MTARALVLGLDGADPDVVLALGAARLPTLHALMAKGAWARLVSVQPPATLPNWTTFLTGVDPGRHGVFDFTTRQGYGVRFTAGTVREVPTLFARLDRLGLRCACLGFPATWPPERLEHGVFVSGWDAPVAFEADRSFVWPPALHDELVARFGTLGFDVGEFDADTPGWHEGLAATLEARIETKIALGEHLLGRGAWDVFALYFGESDTASHHLWAHHDPRSPRHPGPTAASDGLSRVYEALDRAVAKLLVAAGPEAELTIVSDHGSGGSSDVALHLNRALAEANLLRFAPSRDHALFRRAKDFALTRLPPRLKEKLFRLGGAVLPSWLESRTRFGAIDFSRTLAFSDELNYFPGVWLNQVGREPKGFVRAADRDAVRRDVAQALKALRDPWTGQPVVLEAWPREELYEGPFVDRAPDLVLRLALRDGYSWNLLPSNGPGPVFTQLPPEEHLGRKGRSLPGSHRERGFFVAAGPRVAATGEVDAHIADASATMLARLDVAPPPDAAGRVLFEILDELGTSAASLPDAELVRGAGDEAEVEARLRALGYVD